YGDRVELRPQLGDGRSPEASDIAAAVHLSHDVSLALAATLATAHLVLCAPRSAWRPPMRTEAEWGSR
ncbi:MAG: hypothetical protein ACRDZU_14605, partial [Acidimicrobiales bacterium]